MDIKKLISSIIGRRIEKKDLGDIFLKKYIKKLVASETNAGSILSTNEALKQFGRLWGEYKADTMMMFTAIEYDFISNNEFTEKELAAIKMIIGKMGLFLKSCKAEHDAQIAKEQKKLR